MFKTVEAFIEEDGQVRLLEPIGLQGSRRALVTILDETPSHAGDTALLSEAALAQDWLREEEDEAWLCFQEA